MSILRGDGSQAHPAIRMPPIAAAVSTRAVGMEIVFVFAPLELARFLKRIEHVIPFGIDVTGDVVRDLSGGIAQAHALVVRPRAEPQWPALIINLCRAPKAHVMPL